MNQQTHAGVRNSTIVPGGGDRKTVTPAQAGGVFAVGQAAVVNVGKAATGATGGEQDTRAEDIELPDIDSDYGLESDSEDDAASWAASPALRRAIDMQGTLDPAHLFGPMPEFKMEDVFIGARAAKRPRSSSANWTGQDRLTEQEKLEYAKRMNYRDDTALVW
ncbi:hypothetical protein FFLO_04581 [Filobasidium floriforme]|uniref:Inner centromere protein ARK-binding domain-containing protein n=1 Tax=Filobasidium floriforme TaxID=5210 RepID=A0A8K0JP09_9TREE|nr:uncharacterized protein HD553DRAFT_274894 [Filobasidium floriforme]KAG7531087.1 hypothetical protein FFLO_04581 [Filobasidium floriforme]KAH8081540.1 hypothetical protein HD553DRAFT_274894 [Filobasidium floriforme]